MIWNFATEEIAIHITVRSDKISYRVYGWSRRPCFQLNMSEEAMPLLFARGLSSGVCRQIRHEAAYLQIQRTLFRFPHASTLDQFAYALTPNSAKAVRKIALGSDYGVTHRGTDCCGLSFVQLFPGLRHVFVSLGVFRYGERALLHLRKSSLDLRSDFEKHVEEFLYRLVIDKKYCKGVEFIGDSYFPAQNAPRCIF